MYRDYYFSHYRFCPDRGGCTDYGLVGLASINFEKGKPGFIEFVEDVIQSPNLSEVPYYHESDLENRSEHHAYYPFDPVLSFTPAGVNRRIRDIDGNLAPAVVYVSGSKPWLGATFYAKCGDALDITPSWTFEVDGVSHTLTWPTQRVLPGAIRGPGNDFIAQYDYQIADVAIPAGYTLAFEEAQIEFEINDVESQGPVLKPRYCSTLSGGCDVYVVAQQPLVGMFSRSRDALIPRYSSIRNGCYFGHGQNSYDNWVLNTFFGYFSPLTARRGKQGRPLEYWRRSNFASCSNLSDFFRTGSGRCGLFSAYLAEMIVCQGYQYNQSQEVLLYSAGVLSPGLPHITTSDESIGVQATALKYGNAIVHREFWPNAVFAVVNGGNFLIGNAYDLVPSGRSWEWKDFDVLQPPGSTSFSISQGQNVTVPRHIFLNHVLHNFGNFLLDPSYGAFYVNNQGQLSSGIKVMENASVEIVRSVLVQTTTLRNGFSYVHTDLVPVEVNRVNYQDFSNF